MSVFSASTTLWESIVGGFCIGFSALVLLHGAGEVLGFSSLLGTVCITHPKNALTCTNYGFKVAFLASFLLTCQLLVHTSSGSSGLLSQYGGIFDEYAVAPLWIVAISGILAGYGTKLANGCTSGHGISGIGRMSIRSFVAVFTFMSTGFLSASLLGAWPNAARLADGSTTSFYSPAAYGVGIALTVILCFSLVINIFNVRKVNSEKSQSQQKVSAIDATNSTANDDGDKDDIEAQFDDDNNNDACEDEACDNTPSMSSYYLKILAAILAAPIFAFGLAFGGMTKPSKLLGFFDLSGFARGEYDPSLLFLFAAGCAVSFVAYQFVADRGLAIFQGHLPVRTKALNGEEYHLPTNKQITAKLVVGSALFGISIGISGFCPSPSLIMGVGGYLDAMFVWLPLFIVGRFIPEFL